MNERRADRRNATTESAAIYDDRDRSRTRVALNPGGTKRPRLPRLLLFDDYVAISGDRRVFRRLKQRDARRAGSVQLGRDGRSRHPATGASCTQAPGTAEARRPTRPTVYLARGARCTERSSCKGQKGFDGVRQTARQQAHLLWPLAVHSSTRRPTSIRTCSGGRAPGRYTPSRKALQTLMRLATRVQRQARSRAAASGRADSSTRNKAEKSRGRALC